MAKTLWFGAEMVGGPLDGAAVCVPLRQERVDHWVWAHECVVWDSELQMWEWAKTCVSGFYQLAETAGATKVDAEATDVKQIYRWRDLRVADLLPQQWEFGD